jgi:hypothetical protein
MINGIHGWLEMIYKFQNDPHHDGLLIVFLKIFEWSKLICVVHEWLEMVFFMIEYDSHHPWANNPHYAGFFNYYLHELV